MALSRFKQRFTERITKIFTITSVIHTNVWLDSLEWNDIDAWVD